MLPVENYLLYFAKAAWKDNQPSSSTLDGTGEEFEQVDHFARRFIAAIEKQHPKNLKELGCDVVRTALSEAIDYSMHSNADGQSHHLVFDLDSGNLVPNTDPSAQKVAPHPLYELTRAALENNDGTIDLHDVMHRAHTITDSTHDLLKERVKVQSAAAFYPKPRMHGEDVVKGLLLSTPLLMVIVPILTLFFAWWLLPICVVAYGALTFQLSHEMAISRYLQNNRSWLRNLVPADPKERRRAFLHFAIEAVLILACVAFAAWLVFSAASGVGLMAIAYPVCHGIARLNSTENRNLVSHLVNDTVLNNKTQYSLSAKSIPAIVAAAILFVGAMTPPGIIGVSAGVAAVLVVVFAIMVYKSLDNQLRMRASLGAVAEHATGLSQKREFVIPEPHIEPQPSPLLTLREALKIEFKKQPQLKAGQKTKDDLELKQDVKPQIAPRYSRRSH